MCLYVYEKTDKDGEYIICENCNEKSNFFSIITIENERKQKTHMCEHCKHETKYVTTVIVGNTKG